LVDATDKPAILLESKAFSIPKLPNIPPRKILFNSCFSIYYPTYFYYLANSNGNYTETE
jgi:hypothetical protein